MLSVIVLSYNTKDTTLKCLECLYRSTFTDFETIVIDNASTDDTVSAISSTYPQVKLVRNEENIGFSKANNQAMAMANGSVFLLLNSDAFVFYDTLQKMVRLFEEKQDMTIAGCQILNSDGTIQPSWGYFPTLRRIAQLLFFVDNLPIVKDTVDSIHIRSEKRFSTQRKVDWVTGAFIFLRRSVFEKTRGFDENFFMYGEELEWLYRCKKAGFVTVFTPIARVVHLVGQSSPNRAPAILGEMNGWVYWFQKHNASWQRPILLSLCYLGSLLRVFLKPNYGAYYRQAAGEMLQKFRPEPTEE